MTAGADDRLVQRHDDDGLCTLVLNRPAVLNALNRHMFVELQAHIDTLAADPGSVSCVLMLGAGRSFCSGADLEMLKHVSAEMPLDPFEPETIEAFAALPLPTIAAVQGHCFTGGLELALAADIIVAAEDARFADTHARWGLVSAWGMSVRLPLRVGVMRAKELMFTGREVDAREALAIGLVSHVFPRDLFESSARALAKHISRNAPGALRLTKQSIDRALGLAPGAALAQDRALHPGLGNEFAERCARAGLGTRSSSRGRAAEGKSD